jgi:hypothetical protein
LRIPSANDIRIAYSRKEQLFRYYMYIEAGITVVPDFRSFWLSDHPAFLLFQQSGYSVVLVTVNNIY